MRMPLQSENGPMSLPSAERLRLFMPARLVRIRVWARQAVRGAGTDSTGEPKSWSTLSDGIIRV